MNIIYNDSSNPNKSNDLNNILKNIIKNNNDENEQKYIIIEGKKIYCDSDSVY